MLTVTLSFHGQSYWVLSARQVVKSLLRKCVICRQTVGRADLRPDPPPLVSARTKDSRSFEVTGVDFTGALHVKNTGDNKAYNLLIYMWGNKSYPLRSCI